MALKLGCATFSYLYAASFEETLARLAGAGFREVEVTVCLPHFWPRGMDEADRATTRGLLEKYNLKPCLINQRHNDTNIASINPGIREESIRQIKDDIDLAADIGAPLVIVVPGKPTPLFSPPDEEIWRLGREGIEQCVEHGARRGVTCVVENVGYSLCPLGRDLQRMAKEIDSEFCKIHYDVANANVCEPPVEALRELGPWLGSVHLSDNDGKVWSHSAIGEGNIDFVGVCQALQDMSFTGPTVLEINVYDNQDEVMRNGLARLREIGWQP